MKMKRFEIKMVKDKDKLFIECECADRCALLTIEYLKCYEKFYLEFYRKYSFKHKKEIYDLKFTKDQAQAIIEYFQKKLKDKEDIFIECKSSNFSGGLTIEWFEVLDIFCLDFYREFSFKRKKEIFGLTISKDQVQQIIKYLQNNLKEVSS